MDSQEMFDAVLSRALERAEALNSLTAERDRLRSSLHQAECSAARLASENKSLRDEAAAARARVAALRRAMTAEQLAAFDATSPIPF